MTSPSQQIEPEMRLTPSKLDNALVRSTELRTCTERERAGLSPRFAKRIGERP